MEFIEIQFGVKRKGTTVTFSRADKRCKVTAINAPVGRKLAESFKFWSRNSPMAASLDDLVRIAMWEVAWVRKQAAPKEVNVYLRDRFRERMLLEPELGHERAADLTLFFTEAAFRQAERRQRGRRTHV